MANIKIFGDSAVITSGVSKKVMEDLKKFKPETLKIVDPETKDELFSVGLGNTPSFTKYGATFNSVNQGGFATMTLPLPAGLDAEKKAEHVRNNYGYALLNLQKVEAKIAEGSQELIGEFNAMDQAIEVIE